MSCFLHVCSEIKHVIKLGVVFSLMDLLYILLYIIEEYNDNPAKLLRETFRWNMLMINLNQLAGNILTIKYELSLGFLSYYDHRRKRLWYSVQRRPLNKRSLFWLRIILKSNRNRERLFSGLLCTEYHNRFLLWS